MTADATIANRADRVFESERCQFHVSVLVSFFFVLVFSQSVMTNVALLLVVTHSTSSPRESERSERAERALA